MKISFFCIVSAFLMVISMTACGVKNVSVFAPMQSNNLILAVPVPLEYAKENTGFLNGIELANEDIEKMFLPISITVQVEDDKGDFGSAVRLAQSYIDNPDVIGVIGHWYSDICVPISDLYSLGKRTLIVPTVSISSLTSPPSSYVFRNIPADDQISVKMSDYAKKQNVEKAVIYYEDSAYGFEMSNGLEKYATSIGIDVTDKICSPMLEQELPQLAKKWNVLGYDAVFVISNVEEGTEFIKALRSLDFSGLFICSDGMDSDSLQWRLDGECDNVAVSSIYNQEISTEGIKSFKERYYNSYGSEADVWALQAYDCVMIVAEAVANHNVRNSEQLSEYFMATESLNSIWGETSFDNRNEVVGKTVYIKMSEDGRFVFVD